MVKRRKLPKLYEQGAAALDENRDKSVRNRQADGRTAGLANHSRGGRADCPRDWQPRDADCVLRDRGSPQAVRCINRISLRLTSSSVGGSEGRWQLDQRRPRSPLLGSPLLMVAWSIAFTGMIVPGIATSRSVIQGSCSSAIPCSIRQQLRSRLIRIASIAREIAHSMSKTCRNHQHPFAATKGLPTYVESDIITSVVKRRIINAARWSRG